MLSFTSPWLRGQLFKPLFHPGQTSLAYVLLPCLSKSEKLLQLFQNITSILPFTCCRWSAGLHSGFWSPVRLSLIRPLDIYTTSWPFLHRLIRAHRLFLHQKSKLWVTEFAAAAPRLLNNLCTGSETVLGPASMMDELIWLLLWLQQHEVVLYFLKTLEHKPRKWNARGTKHEN